VLQLSSGIDSPGSVVGHLAITLLIAWTACYFCTWKGIRWTGKVCVLCEIIATALGPHYNRLILNDMGISGII